MNWYTPSALHFAANDSIGVGAILMVNEPYAMVDGAVCITSRVEIAVRTPAVTDDRSAGFDPCIYNGHQSVGGSVPNGNKKRSPGLALNTAEHPLPLNRMAPAVKPCERIHLFGSKNHQRWKLRAGNK